MAVSYATGVSTITATAIDGTETMPTYMSALVAQAELAGATGCKILDPQYTPASISAITLANPGVFTTTAPHGLVVGDLVYIAGIVGTTQLNSRSYLVNTVPTTSTFTLKTYSATGAYRAFTQLTTVGMTAWSSGGTVYKLQKDATLNNVQVVPSNNPSAWLVIDRDFYLRLTGSTYFNPTAESSANANDGGATVLAHNSTVYVEVTTTRNDASAAGCKTGGKFFALRTPNGVNPQIIHATNQTIRYDYPTLPLGTTPSEYRIEGLSVYSTGDSRKWYGGVSRNSGGRDTMSNIQLSGGGEIFQIHSSTYTKPFVPTLTVISEVVTASSEVIQGTYGTEQSATQSFDPYNLRRQRLWLTDCTYSGWYNGTVNVPINWYENAYFGMRYTNSITCKSGVTPLQNVLIRRKRSVYSGTAGYDLSSLVFGAEASDRFLNTDVNGLSSTTCTDVFIAHSTAGIAVAGTTEYYSWLGQARKYDYKTPANTIFTGRKFGYGGSLGPITEEIQMTAVPNLVASQATAHAYTGIALVASGATSGTITVTGNHTTTELWEFYRDWISTQANFDSNDTWNYNGTTLDLGAWNITINNAVVTGSVTTTGTATLIGTGSVTGKLTDSTGTLVSVTLSNIVTGSMVQLYNLDTSTELTHGTVSGTTFSYNIKVTAPINFRYRIMYCSGTTAKMFIEENDVISLNGFSKVINQVDDTVYIANAINGSAVTNVTITDASFLVSINTGSISWKQLYAYETYWLSTYAGIVDEGRFSYAVDTANYIWYNFKIKNTSAVPLTITGGWGRDGVTGLTQTLIDTTGNDVFSNPDQVIAYATGSALTTAQDAKLMSLKNQSLLIGGKIII